MNKEKGDFFFIHFVLNFGWKQFYDSVTLYKGWYFMEEWMTGIRTIESVATEGLKLGGLVVDE